MPDGLGTIAAIGGIVLAAILLFAMLRNRQTPAEERRTEAATHDLYAEIDREDEASDPDREDMAAPARGSDPISR